MKKYKYYISCYPRNDSEVRTLKSVASVLREEVGDDKVYVPYEHYTDEKDELINEEWSIKYMKDNLLALLCSEEVYVIDRGSVGSISVGYEVGYAYARGIPITVHSKGKDISYLVAASAVAFTNGSRT